MERILVFSSREICYRSSNFFANQIGAAFEKLGYQTEVCEMSPEDDLDTVLEPLLDKKYRLILDFNSRLPHLEMDDGVPFLDCLDGPFFDYIVDHPLFHHNGLATKAKNMHVLVLDEAQRDYVQTYYPNVASVHMLPLGATQALYEGEKYPECRVFFPGTYDSPDAVYDVVEASPEPFRGMMKEIIARRIEEPLLPMEQAFRELLASMDMEVEPAQFALFMNGMYASDAFIRDYFRKKALDELLKEQLPVTVLGEGWEKYHHPDEKTLKRERALPFGLSFERIAKEHILLNVSPIFNRGMHDRVPAGMANHTVVLTDGNPYLSREFLVGEEICCYDLAKIETLSACAGELIENSALRGKIEHAAYQNFLEHHTWEGRAKEILNITDKLTR